MIAASHGDSASLEARLASRPSNMPAGTMVMAAWLGDRRPANQTAAALDKLPDGPLLIELAMGVCLCGWPFDLNVTPNYAARLRQAGHSVNRRARSNCR